MTATTVSLDTPRRDGTVVAHGVTKATKVLKGTLVQLASGYLTSMTKAASLVPAGVAYEEIYNASSTDGAVKCKVYREGTFEFILTGAAVTDIGTVVYALDNQTVTKTSTDATAVGKIAAVENTNKAFIDIRGYC